MLEQVAANSDTGGGLPVSQQGVLAYQTRPASRGICCGFDRTGDRLGEVGDPSGYENPAVSDLQRVAVAIKATSGSWMQFEVEVSSSRWILPSMARATLVAGRTRLSSNRRS